VNRRPLIALVLLAGLLVVPTAVGPTTSVAIAAGSASAADGTIKAATVSAEGSPCVLTTAGGVRCWGRNNYGQLGTGTHISSSVPVGVVGLGSGVVALSTGVGQCAVTSTGALKCWGLNDKGQLGNGNHVGSSVPVGVVGLGSGMATVSASGQHTCAVTTAGAVKCWGYNGDGELGNGTITVMSFVPVSVVGLGSRVARVSAGQSHSCAVTTAGAIKCWGSNFVGELGNGTTTRSAVPVGVVGLGSGVVAVSAGGSHSCAVTSAGAVKCWGFNGDGELGNGTTTSSSVPVGVVGLGSGVVAVFAGFTHSCAVTSAGAVKCWGENAYGQLGNGTTTSSLVPVGVVGLSSTAVAVSADWFHSCAATSAGAVKCWGRNEGGELGNGTSTGSTVPVFVVGLGAAAVTRLSDFNKDGATDLVARDAAGRLWLYPGNGFGGFKSRRQIGVGWNSVTAIVTPGDVTGDGNADVLARDSVGRLWLYPGNGIAGFGARRQIGSGWGSYTITNAANLNGVGRPDVLARDAAGALWLYPLTGNAVFGSRSKIGAGWNGYTILGPGDVSGDTRADILARDTTGSFLLYRGTGTGRVGGRTLVSAGWAAMTALVTPGNWDRAAGNDVLARDAAGALWLHPGNNAGGLDLARQIGSGWGGFTYIG
jgi:alpha-tubulin suppressor-like RCC1 family protein